MSFNSSMEVIKPSLPVKINRLEKILHFSIRQRSSDLHLSGSVGYKIGTGNVCASGCIRPISACTGATLSALQSGHSFDHVQVCFVVELNKLVVVVSVVLLKVKVYKVHNGWWW